MATAPAWRDWGGLEVTANVSDDSAAIREVLSGRTEAFQGLVDRYFATVRLVALAKTGNAADAEDVAQETFIKAYETLGVLRNRERLAPWLVSIARNRAITLVRRRERERRHAAGMRMDPRVYPDHEKRETLDAVARQVEALPDNLREVVLLHYFEGLKCREIGERLDLNTNAVVKRLSRGREVLGGRLLREWGEGARTDNVSIQRVMGAIVALPKPDWQMQAASMATGGGNIGGGQYTIWRLTVPAGAVKEGAIVVIASVLSGLLLFQHFRSPEEGTHTAVSQHRAMASPAEPSSGPPRKVDVGGDDGDGTYAATPAALRAPATPARPRVEVGFVAGRVFDQDGHPMRDARLWAESYAGSRLGGAAATNPNGDFRINVTAGAEETVGKLQSLMIEVSCSKPGYGPMYRRVALNTSHQEFHLLRAAALEGTVIDARTRHPIGEFGWRIERPRGGDTWPGVGTRTYNSEWREVRSKTGSFRADDEHGIVAVSILADGYAGARVPVEVPLGSSASGLVIALEPGQQLTGVVLDRTARHPLAGVSVGVRPDPSLAFFRHHTKSDKDGNFSFRDMPTAVPITLTANQFGSGSVSVTLSPGELSEPVEIYLGGGAQISGMVRYRGAPPRRISEGRYGVVYVRGTTEGSSEVGSGAIQSDGSYIVTGLSDGWYTVNAWFIKGDRGREGMSQYRLTEVREGRDVVFDIDGESEGGRIEVALDGLEGALPLRFDLISMAVPEAVVSSQVGADVRRYEEVDPALHFGWIEPGFYRLRATDPGTGAVLFEESVSVSEGQAEALAIDLGAFDDDTGLGSAAVGQGEEHWPAP